jgi:hypothetical protein
MDHISLLNLCIYELKIFYIIYNDVDLFTDVLDSVNAILAFTITPSIPKYLSSLVCVS